MPEKMADLPAMKTNPKFIFFTDFDGTITTQDSMQASRQTEQPRRH